MYGDLLGGGLFLPVLATLLISVAVDPKMLHNRICRPVIRVEGLGLKELFIRSTK